MIATTTAPPTPTAPPISAPSAIGRPRALDEVKRGQICSLVSAGCGLEKAARYVGCAASTIRREARRNREFAQQLRRASMASELEALHAIHRAAGTHWRAAAWLLKRADTDDLRSKQSPTQRHSTPKARPVEISEIERFASALQSMVVNIVPDNATMYQLTNRINELLAAAKSTPTTAPDADPPLASDSDESSSADYQPEA